jgi:hypothetical protein
MSPEDLTFLGLSLLGLGVRLCYERLRKSGRVNSRNKSVFMAVFVAFGHPEGVHSVYALRREKPFDGKLSAQGASSLPRGGA